MTVGELMDSGLFQVVNPGRDPGRINVNFL